MHEIENKLKSVDSNLTSLILASCYEVMNELGIGFLEAVYKNALAIVLRNKGLDVQLETPLEVYFRSQKVGIYRADLIVANSVIVELKCCKELLPEHQAQVINYLKAIQIPVGLLVNFGKKQLEFKRMSHPSLFKNYIPPFTS